MKQKTILHLCADIGSDSYFYQQDKNYKVILVGENIGVENYHPDEPIYGIIANPVCTEFSTAGDFRHVKDLEKGMVLVNHCLRIIKEANPKWWCLENPFNGRLKEIIGKPKAVYQPWQYGSPWTKKTALWGEFNMPSPLFKDWSDIHENTNLYIRKGRQKAGLVYLHKSAINFIPEFKPFVNHIQKDSDFRSLCSQGFAEQFYLSNP